MALKYGGKTISDYSAMQGPCPKGFHIPNKNERENVIAAGATLGAYVRATGSGHVSDSEIPFRLQFKIPRISRREASGELVDASRFGHTHYWTYETSSGGIGYTLGIIDSYGSVRPNIYQSYSSNNEGRPIRPFKDVPVAPDNTRTRTYDGSSVAQGAGIFYNSSLKIISVSADGTTRYTIADRDIGATNTYTNASAGVQSDAIGSLFQRGNNYQFSPTGSVTTSATQVDASDYGPGNYYYGSARITTTQRDSSNNRNLRGGETGVRQKPVDIVERYYGGKLIDDYSAMRGPCDEGFHIPSKEEWDSIISIGTALSAWSNTTQCETILNLTNHKYINSTNGTYVTTLNGAVVLTSSQSSSVLYAFKTTASTINTGSVPGNRNHAFQIRPFKDKPAIPDSSRTTLVDGSSVASGAGIFSNSSLGLISLSSDGITWITMAIKNLGAPDTTTEGYYYQWGNNNGFVANGYTTSSTKVDVSNYGPGNYYSSNVFITQSPRWSGNGRNLRGGVTGIQQKPTKVIEVYYGSTKIWPSYPAGVYWNPNIDGGVISISSNGTDWLTMADKNLGATTVYNYGDTMTEANCGKYYQWGNNYAFPFSGTPSISSTKVDISSYGPGNYYSNSTFRRVSGDGYWWTSASATAATNLWGEQTNTNEARRGPCPEGFHIPSHNEIIAWRNMTGLEYADRLRICKIPMMGTRDNYTGGVVDRGTDGGMRTTTLYDSDSAQGGYYSSYGVCRGLPIRPFRNEAIMPDDTRVAILN